MVEAFEGNKAETKTMLPVITAFMTAHQLTDVTVVADAGMISEVNQQAIEDTGLSFILGTRIPDVPYAVARWRREHPGQDLPDGHVFTQPWPTTGAQKAAGCRDKIARRYRTVQIRAGQHILTAQSRYHPTCAMPSRSSGGQAVRTSPKIEPNVGARQLPSAVCAVGGSFVRAGCCGVGKGQAAWVSPGPAGSGSGAGVRQRVTSRPWASISRTW